MRRKAVENKTQATELGLLGYTEFQQQASRSGVMGTWSKMLAAAVLVLGNAGVHAALDVGEVAPQFTAQAALAGTVIRYSLAERVIDAQGLLRPPG